MKLLKNFFNNWLVYSLLLLILAGSLFIRVYRTGDLLQFYYDQGRDALVIWDLWHKGKPFLIGPVTGLKGIFLGPFYYYLIAPFYLIGGGNPVYPAVFLEILGVGAVFMLYLLGKKMHSRSAGLIAATIGGFSYYIATFNRWLSNPNPILLTSLIFLWSLWEISNSKSNSKSKMVWYIAATLIVGVSLHFESASSVFYIPILGIFFIWQNLVPRGGLFSQSRGFLRLIFWMGLAFFITLLPQIIFNFRHDNLLFNNFKALFFEEKAFRPFTSYILHKRMEYFWRVFTSKFLLEDKITTIFFMTTAGAMLICGYNKFKAKILPIFGIFLLTPMVGYLLFQGNYGNIYDYYMSGYFMPFILLFSISLGELWHKKLGFLIVMFFFLKFFPSNYKPIRYFLTSDPVGRPISLEEQLPAVNWILEDGQKHGEFNVDIYVPPVIPYSYDYLLLWQATKRCGENLCGMTEKPVDTLYLLIEPDDEHPERIGAWLNGQDRIALVEEEERIGHLTLQRRKRL